MDAVAPELSYLHDAQQIATGLREQCSEAEDCVRYAILAAILEALLSTPPAITAFAMRGIRLPFGLRSDPDATQALLILGKRLVAAVEALTIYGEPLARGISADLLSNMPGATRDVELLKQIVELRGGNARWQGLQDERSILLCLRDQLLIAQIEQDRDARREVLHALVALSQSDALSVAPLVLIAADLETHGACPTPLPPGLDDRVRGLWNLIGHGRHQDVLIEAAARALRSPDVATVSLGGRSDVTTVRDYYGLVGETLIFKKTTVATWQREWDRTFDLTRALHSQELEGEFGFVESLGSRDGFAGDPQTEIGTVRRFHRGQSLYDAVRQEDRAGRVELLSSTARFLGWMNRVERADTRDGARKELKAKEVGRRAPERSRVSRSAGM